MLRFLHIGGDYYISIDKILSFSDATTYSAKHMIRDAKETGQFLNYTTGKKARTIILTTDGKLIASFLGPKTLAKRVNEDPLGNEKEPENDGQVQDSIPPLP